MCFWARHTSRGTHGRFVAAFKLGIRYPVIPLAPLAHLPTDRIVRVDRAIPTPDAPPSAILYRLLPGLALQTNRLFADTEKLVAAFYRTVCFHFWHEKNKTNAGASKRNPFKSEQNGDIRDFVNVQNRKRFFACTDVSNNL